MPRKKKNNDKRTFSVARIIHPEYPDIVVRVGEYAPGGMLHVFRWIDGRQVSRTLKVRASELGSDPEKMAKQLACAVIKRWATEGDAADGVSSALHSSGVALTIKGLADRYEEDEVFKRKTPGYQRDALASIRRIAAYVGDVAVNALTPGKVEAYLGHRREQGYTVAGRADIVALSIAINWAIGEKIDNSLRENPLGEKKVTDLLKKYKGTPRRPVANKDRYRALKAKAGELPPGFGVLLTLAWETGHRHGAVLGLRWGDISFKKTVDAPYGSIRWYRGKKEDNKGREHLLPMNDRASASLAAWKKKAGVIGASDALVFPAPEDPTQPLGRHVTKKWLRRAETLAKLDHQKHGGWHMFRRGWASARKHLPPKDVAAAGDWRDLETLMRCYVHEDAETIKKVVLTVA